MEYSLRYIHYDLIVHKATVLGVMVYTANQYDAIGAMCYNELKDKWCNTRTLHVQRAVHLCAMASQIVMQHVHNIHIFLKDIFVHKGMMFLTLCF